MVDITGTLQKCTAIFKHGLERTVRLLVRAVDRIAQPFLQRRPVGRVRVVRRRGDAPSSRAKAHQEVWGNRACYERFSAWLFVVWDYLLAAQRWLSNPRPRTFHSQRGGPYHAFCCLPCCFSPACCVVCCAPVCLLRCTRACLVCGGSAVHPRLLRCIRACLACCGSAAHLCASYDAPTPPWRVTGLLCTRVPPTLHPYPHPHRLYYLTLASLAEAGRRFSPRPLVPSFRVGLTGWCCRCGLCRERQGGCCCSASSAQANIQWTTS